jgi:hypothetical protein
MSKRIREHIRSNVIGYIALFVALGGVAYAQGTVGSEEVIDNSLRSVDLKDNAAVKSADVVNDSTTGGGLAGADLRADSVGTSEVTDGSLGGADIDEAGVPVGGDLTGFLSGAQIAANAVGTSEVAVDSLGSADLAAGSVGASEVADDSLGGSDIAEATLDVSNGSAKSGELAVNCDPTSGTFTSCASTTLTNSAGVNVLVIGTGAWFGTQGVGAADEGSCRIFRDGNQLVPPFMELGQGGDQHNSDNRGDGFAIVTVDTAASAGTHTWELKCNQFAGNFQVADARIAVLAVEG